MRFAVYAFALVAALGVPSGYVWADDENSCDHQCGEDEVNVSFLDGQWGSCLCVPRGEGMVDVVPEASVGSESDVSN